MDMPGSLPQQQAPYYAPQQQYYQQQMAPSDKNQPQLLMPTQQYANQPPTMAQQYANQPQPQQQMQFSQPNPYVQSSVSNNNALPMPDITPKLFSTVMNNSMVGGMNGKNGVIGNGGGGNEHRQPVEMKEFAKEPKEVLNQLITAEMKDHWSQIEKFNLLDSERLDHMYMYHDAFLEDKKFLYIYLCAEYRNKYSELFEMYESLEVYVSFAILLLIYGSEVTLKEACDINNAFVQPPRVGESSFKLRLFNRKRKTSTTASSMPIAVPENEEETAKRRRLSEITQVPTTSLTTSADDHPFFKEDLYQSHMRLFKLGELVKYCVPSEFAIMFCTATMATLNVFTQGDNKAPYRGVRVSFSKPVVSLIRSRNLKTFNYQSLELYGLLGEFVSIITGRSTDQEAFRLSSLKEMKMQDLTTQNSIIPINWGCSAGFNMALVTNFACTDTVMGVLNNRAYCTPIYHIPKSFVDVSEDDREDMGDKASNHKNYEHREKQLNDYYDRLESMAVTT